MSWDEVIALATRQNGVIARRQALELVTASTRDRRVGPLRQPFPGVALLPGARWDDTTRTSAAVLAAGASALATRESALFMHGVSGRAPRDVQVLLPHPLRARSLPGAQVSRSRTLEAPDRTVRHGIPTATIPRAFLDLTAKRRPKVVRARLIDVSQRNPDILREIGARAARARGANGRPALLRLVADLDPAVADSILADEVHRRLVADGFRPDPTPVPVVISDRVLHPDITFSPQKVGIESDGLTFHSSRSQLEVDHRKHNAYLVAGWGMLRIGAASRTTGAASATSSTPCSSDRVRTSPRSGDIRTRTRGPGGPTRGSGARDPA